MMLTLWMPTHCSNEHWKPAAPIVRAEMTPGTFERIKALREELTRLRAEEITIWGQEIESWGRGWDEDGAEYEDEDLRVEIERLEVSSSGFRWTCYVDEAPDQLMTDFVDWDHIENYTRPPWERAKETPCT